MKATASPTACWASLVALAWRTRSIQRRPWRANCLQRAGTEWRISAFLAEVPPSESVGKGRRPKPVRIWIPWPQLAHYAAACFRLNLVAAQDDAVNQVQRCIRILTARQ